MSKISPIDQELKHLQDVFQYHKQNIKDYSSKINLILKKKNALIQVQKTYPNVVLAVVTPKAYEFYLHEKFLTNETIMFENGKNYYSQLILKRYIEVSKHKVYLDKNNVELISWDQKANAYRFHKDSGACLKQNKSFLKEAMTFVEGISAKEVLDIPDIIKNLKNFQ